MPRQPKPFVAVSKAMRMPRPSSRMAPDGTASGSVGAQGRPLRRTETTFRDSMGRTTGTATTDSSGKTTYRDSMGRVTCTATKDSTGKIIYRDSMGRMIGTQK